MPPLHFPLREIRREEKSRERAHRRAQGRAQTEPEEKVSELKSESPNPIETDHIPIQDVPGRIWDETHLFQDDMCRDVGLQAVSDHRDNFSTHLVMVETLSGRDAQGHVREDIYLVNCEDKDLIRFKILKMFESVNDCVITTIDDLFKSFILILKILFDRANFNPCTLGGEWTDEEYFSDDRSEWERYLLNDVPFGRENATQAEIGTTLMWYEPGVWDRNRAYDAYRPIHTYNLKRVEMDCLAHYSTVSQRLGLEEEPELIKELREKLILTPIEWDPDEIVEMRNRIEEHLSGEPVIEEEIQLAQLPDEDESYDPEESQEQESDEIDDLIEESDDE